LSAESIDYWSGARRAEKQAASAETRGQDMYKAYCDAMEEQLGALYAAVEGDFSTYYQDINSDDEGAFKARLEPSEGKLDLEVAFYDKGMFPPAAYHSDGAGEMDVAEPDNPPQPTSAATGPDAAAGVLRRRSSGWAVANRLVISLQRDPYVATTNLWWRIRHLGRGVTRKTGLSASMNRLAVTAVQATTAPVGR
jgi:hypothetical protein